MMAIDNDGCHRQLPHSCFDNIRYQGQWSFHNFTVDVDRTDAKAERLINKVYCANQRKLGGINFVSIIVEGVSFQYHQIRKMLGLAFLVIRHSQPNKLITDAMNRKT